MKIETTYRGYKITWSENGDHWQCWEAGAGIENKSLLKLKQAIDRLALTERKNAAYPCFEISDYHSEGRKTESQITQYMKRKVHRAWGKEEEKIEHVVAVVAKRDGSTKASRRETELHKLMPDTPEALAAWEIWRKLRRVAKIADDTAKEAFKAIPRVELADIQKLVDLYEAEKASIEAAGEDE